MPTFRQSPEPASVQRITDFERSVGIDLPSDYMEFLRTTNGGVPRPNGFDVPMLCEALVDFLYGIRDERVPGDLEYELGQAQEWEPLPSGFLIIGHDPGGNALLLATEGRERGTVYYWDRDGDSDSVNTYPVASSFIAFLDGLNELKHK